MDKEADHVRTKAGSLRAADENYDYDQDQDKEGSARPGKDFSSGALTRLVFGARILSKPDEDAVYRGTAARAWRELGEERRLFPSSFHLVRVLRRRYNDPVREGAGLHAPVRSVLRTY
jgi:hypothetical protein